MGRHTGPDVTGFPQPAGRRLNAALTSKYSGNKMIAEQRKLKRFNTDNEAFAAFIRPNEPVIVGRIMDISQGGIAVRYLANGDLGVGFAEIRIFGPNVNPTNPIQCEIIYDKVLAEESWDVFSVRRCGVKFNRIVSFDSAKLKALMKGRRVAAKGSVPSNSFPNGLASF